jgi:hypothetical protein
MKLFEQDWSKINLDDIPEDGTVIVNKSKTPAAPADVKKIDTAKSTVDMSALTKFGTGTPIGKAVRYVVNNNTYTFYPNGKVYSSSDKKQLSWYTKGKNVFVNNVELINTTPDRNTRLSINLSKNVTEIKKMIVNGIMFNYKFSREINANITGNDTDEEAVWRLCGDRLTNAVDTMYVDIVLRIIYARGAKGTLSTFIQKNPKAYNYFLSRNKTAVTREALQTAPQPPEHGISQIFSDKQFGYLDWDSDEAVPIINQLIMSSFDRLEPYKYVKLRMKLSAAAIHERVMIIYNDKLFGPPKEWLR